MNVGLRLACIAFVLAAPLTAATTSLQTSGAVHVTALAVADTPQGFVGVHADVEATALAGGSGRVYVSTKPLAEADMQGSARLASQVAAATLGADWKKQDYLVSFRSDSLVIGGPSAGAVMTLGLTAALHNLLHPEDAWTLDPTVAGTGTINPDGTIGPVGGIPAKAEGAAQAGIKTFLYPAGMDQASTRTAQGTVVVDMQQHCADLHITCRPAATIQDVLEAAAHVRLQTQDVAVPGTTGYAAQLGPGVRARVDALGTRIDGLPSRPGYGGLSPSQKATVDQQAEAARADLANARTALDGGTYYRAATEVFKGAIAADNAENLTAFYAQGRAESVVTDALAACQKAAQAAANDVNGLEASGLNALYAIGAGQERAAEAAGLYAQAKSAHDQATTYNDWVQSLETSDFCVERAATAGWWADLRNVFPPGPAFGDGADVAQNAIDQATELVAYATNVLTAGGVGADQNLQLAQSRLQAAQDAQKVDRYPSAAVQAVEAQAYASAAVQLAGGSPVPPAVLDAARQAAARAVDRARTNGVEPVLSVSLIELAQTEKDAGVSLQELWTARSLALLDLTPGTAPRFLRIGPSSASDMSALVIGAGSILALALLGIAVASMIGGRRHGAIVASPQPVAATAPPGAWRWATQPPAANEPFRVAAEPAPPRAVPPIPPPPRTPPAAPEPSKGTGAPSRPRRRSPTRATRRRPRTRDDKE